MAEAGYINPLSPSATDWVKSNDISIAVDAVSWKGKLYAYPQDEQSNIVYYNKAKFSEAPKDWADFTAETPIGTDFTNSYNWYPVFLANGTQLFGKDGETVDGTDANTKAGVQAMTWFAQQKQILVLNSQVQPFWPTSNLVKHKQSSMAHGTVAQ